MLIFLVLLYLSINNSLSASQMFPPQNTVAQMPSPSEMETSWGAKVDLLLHLLESHRSRIPAPGTTAFHVH